MTNLTQRNVLWDITHMSKYKNVGIWSMDKKDIAFYVKKI